MHYLPVACEELHKLLLATVEPTRAELTPVFILACTTFRRLASDNEFLGDFGMLARRRQKEAHVFDDITTLEHFVHSFRSIEGHVLKKAKLTDATIGRLIDKATDLLDYIKQPSATAEELSSRIAKLRDEACPIATSLKEQGRTDVSEERLAEMARRFGFAIGGAAMISVNASAWAASVGLTTAGSAVSGAAGSALIGYAVASGQARPR